MTGDIDARGVSERDRLAALLADWDSADILAARALIVLSTEGDARLGRVTAMGRQFVVELRRRVADGGAAAMLEDPPCLRERILEAAACRIVHAGPRALTVGAVSVEAGIPRRTVYNLYASGDDLFDACRRRNAAVWRARFEQRVVAARPDAVERVLEVPDAIDSWVGSARFRGDEALSTPATFADDLRDDDVREHLAEIERFALRLAAGAKLAAPDEFAALVVTCIAGAAAWYDRRTAAHAVILRAVRRMVGTG